MGKMVTLMSTILLRLVWSGMCQSDRIVSVDEADDD